MPECPMYPPESPEHYKPNINGTTIPKIRDINFPWVEEGGRSKPKGCTARHKVAIIVPFRDTEEHLRIFLYNIHLFLAHQQLDYAIYVVEQYGNGSFNKGWLMNIGAKEALKQYPYDCLVFHDVNLIPENSKITYNCTNLPRHFSAAVDKFNYRLPFPEWIEGVLGLRTEHYKLVNGYSNSFLGWGDDMFRRIEKKLKNITRYPSEIARYTTITNTITLGKKIPNTFNIPKIHFDIPEMANGGFNLTEWVILLSIPTKLYHYIVALPEDEISKKSNLSGYRVTDDGPMNMGTKYH